MSGFFAALWAGWIALAAAGLTYAVQEQIPPLAAVPVIAAFLVEYAFYLIPGVEAVHKRLRLRYSKRQLAAGAAVSALAPYLAYSAVTGQFRLVALALLAVLVVLVCFWYAVFRPSAAADVAFLCLAAAPLLAHTFRGIYTSPIRQPIDILGHLMWIRTGAFALLAIRTVENTGFGFLPSPRDWRIGGLHFALFLPVGFPLALALGLVRFDAGGLSPWKVAGVFFGTLWVVALSEEFVFRGLLQRWIEQWTHSPGAALAASAILFGLCHLPFRGFPNWKMALVAALAGLFYGRARNQAGGIRAAMVAHALVVTAWRNLFV